MSNPETSRCGGLRLECGCRPDPVPSTGAMHETTVVNFGYDRYTVNVQVRIMSGSRPGTSLALHDGVRQVDVVRWFAGTFGPSRKGSWPQAVGRRAGGTAKAHSIRTTAEFASDAESDPLDDEATATYTCTCTVDVVVV
jgi:hypothetical protein